MGYNTAAYKDIVGYNPARFRAGLKTALYCLREGGVCWGGGVIQTS